jgi:acyl-CoA thioester hydrolase
MHTLSCRVYYEDTDAGGVVYYANYLRFAERGRSEWMRAVLKPEGPLWSGDGPLFMMRHTEVDYLASARLDDLLTIETRLTHLGGASIGMTQIIRRDEHILVSLKVALVCVDSNGKVLRIPAPWRDTFTPYLKEGA